MKERVLLIPTFKPYREALKTISFKTSKAFLFNPCDDSYVLQGNRLYKDGVELSFENIRELAADSATNMPLEHTPLLYGLFCLLHIEQLTSGTEEWRQNKNKVIKWLGHSTGAHGFKLMEKLKVLSGAYGVIMGQGVYRLWSITDDRYFFKLNSRYIKSLYNNMRNDAQTKGYKHYYCRWVQADAVACKSDMAVLILIEIASYIARTQGYPERKVSLSYFIERIPLLAQYCSQHNNIGQLNRQLCRWFTQAFEMIDMHTMLREYFPGLSFGGFKPDIRCSKKVFELNL